MDADNADTLTVDQVRAQPGLLISMIPPAPPGVAESYKNYVADIPKLLRQSKFRNRWVAYHGKKRVGVGDSQTALFKDCLARGIPRDEFYVGLVTPLELPSNDARHS